MNQAEQRQQRILRHTGKTFTGRMGRSVYIFETRVNRLWSLLNYRAMAVCASSARSQTHTCISLILVGLVRVKGLLRVT